MFDSKAKRQKELHKKFNFQCKCERCELDSEFSNHRIRLDPGYKALTEQEVKDFMKTKNNIRKLCFDLLKSMIIRNGVTRLDSLFPHCMRPVMKNLQ